MSSFFGVKLLTFYHKCDIIKNKLYKPYIKKEEKIMKKLLSNPLTDVILSALAILAAVANAALAACRIGYLAKVLAHSLHSLRERA